MLRKPSNLILYLFGNNSSIFGDVLLTTALALHIMSITNSPQAYAGIIALAFVPRFIFSIFSGAIVDRLDKKKLMIGLDLLRGSVLIGFLFVDNITLNLITPMILIFAVSDTFFLPASVSIMPRLFKPEALSKVNGIDQSIRNTLNVISPLIASMLYITGGIHLVFLIDGITFICSALSEWLFDLEAIKITAKKTHILADMKDGIKVIFSDIRITSLMFNGSLTHLFLFAFIEVGMISLTLITFNSPETHYGIIQSAISAGAIVAAFVALALRGKKMLYEHINRGIIGMLVSVLLFAPLAMPGFINWLKAIDFGPVIYLSLACFIMYLSFGYYIVFYRSFYQTNVPKAYLGRYTSIFIMMISLTRIVGTSVFGALFESQNITLTIGLLGIGMILKLIVHIPFVKEEQKRQRFCLDNES